jgi:hypothetical protein
MPQDRGFEFAVEHAIYLTEPLNLLEFGLDRA